MIYPFRPLPLMKGCREKERREGRTIYSFRPLPLMKGCTDRERERTRTRGLYKDCSLGSVQI